MLPATHSQTAFVFAFVYHLLQPLLFSTTQISKPKNKPLEFFTNPLLVTPNSFGFMDGGIDHLYSRRFGWEVQERLQNVIQELHHGELLVGAAEIVETHSHIPFLIAAPTMRVPMILRDSVNPYLAARAAFLLMKYGYFRAGDFKGTKVSDAVKSIAFPGLGTGIGQIGPDVCAHQVRTAIEDVILESRPFSATWAEAQARHQQLYTDRIRDLQRE